jgi:hypothetical protein
MFYQSFSTLKHICTSMSFFMLLAVTVESPYVLILQHGLRDVIVESASIPLLLQELGTLGCFLTKIQKV